MPVYFEKNSLDVAQRRRWDWAVAEYQRVQEANVDRELLTMTASEQSRLLASFRDRQPDDSKTLRDYLLLMGGLMAGGAGNPKSALFARLLDGKPALPLPPPTSYSYPWYSVVEQAGPHQVCITGVPTVGGIVRGTGGAKGVFTLGINQCAWAVLWYNEAAQRLRELQEELAATATPEAPGSHYCCYSWSATMLKDVVEAYQARPEFIVRHSLWPEFRLHLGRSEAVSARGYAQDVISGIAQGCGDMLDHCASVFDASRLYLNPEFDDKVVSVGRDPKLDLEEARVHALTIEASTQASQKGGQAGDQFATVQAFLATRLAKLADDVVKLDTDPTRNHVVRVSYDDWALTRA